MRSSSGFLFIPVGSAPSSQLLWTGGTALSVLSSGQEIAAGRVALVIGTWGYAYDDTYDHIIDNIMVILKLHKVETIEALSACGFEGILHGLDKKGRGVIAKYPKELKKAYDAGAALVKT